MNIKTRLEKLEKVINTCKETPESLKEKFGVFPIMFNSEEEVGIKRLEYFTKMAKGLNMTVEEAEKFHAEAYKKAGWGKYITIIDNIDNDLI